MKADEGNLPVLGTRFSSLFAWIIKADTHGVIRFMSILWHGPSRGTKSIFFGGLDMYGNGQSVWEMISESARPVFTMFHSELFMCRVLVSLNFSLT